MPELPEVENIAIGLTNSIKSKAISRVDLYRDDILHFPDSGLTGNSLTTELVGKSLLQITRRAKRLLIQLDGGSALLIQLGMTGRFVITDAKTELEKHAHLVLTLNNGSQLRFIDHRRFGRVWYFRQLNISCPDQQMEAAGLGRLGPEPFDLSASCFHQKLSGGNRNIKAFLLDQTSIAGLGNIYADESLFAAGIHPETRTCDISQETASLLLRKIKAILKKAISSGGTSFSDYRNAYGEIGRFQEMLKVYQRTGQPCRICRTPIEKITITGRSSHFCPKCQPKKPN